MRRKFGKGRDRNVEIDFWARGRVARNQKPPKVKFVFLRGGGRGTKWKISTWKLPEKGGWKRLEPRGSTRREAEKASDGEESNLAKAALPPPKKHGGIQLSKVQQSTL